MPDTNWERDHACSICHERFRTAAFAQRCEAQGLPLIAGLYRLGDVLTAPREAGRVAVVVEHGAHHGPGKCPVNGPCEHAVQFQLSLYYPTYSGKNRIWIACLGRLPSNYIPPNSRRLASLSTPDQTSWGIIEEQFCAATYLVGESIDEDWQALWEVFPDRRRARVWIGA